MQELLWDNEEEEKLKQQMMEGFSIIQSTNFQEQLWNEAGPKMYGITQKLGHMKEEFELMKKGKEHDTKQFSNRLLTLLYQDQGHEEGDLIVVDKLIGHMDHVEKFLEDTRCQERIDIMKSRILEGEDDANEGKNNSDPGFKSEAVRL